MGARGARSPPGRPRREVRSPAGQAAVDYAAVLLVVVLALALGAAAAVPGVGERVVAGIRTGICVVGGDICRDRDARAAGLEPCVTREREQGTQTAVDLAVVHAGEDGRWAVAVRSDGSAVVTRTEGRAVGAVLQPGVGFGPVGLQVGAGGRVTVVRRSARSWRFADLAGARDFLDLALGPEPFAADRVPPDERWTAFGAGVEGTVSGTVPVVAAAGGRIAVDGALGRRTGGGRTTWFFRSRLDEPQVFATLPAWSSSGTGAEAMVELTADAGGVRELVLRTARAEPDRVEEVTARLDLRDPAIRSRLGAGAPWPPAVLRELAGLAATRGIVERQVHVVDDRSRTYGGTAKLLVALGLEHTRVDVRSRLADAAVWIAGSGPLRREDCLTA
jgi:hypothetical protein